MQFFDSKNTSLLHLWIVVLIGLGSLVAGPTAAHVDLIPGSVRPAGYVTMALSVYHGCGTSPTTWMSLEVPEGVAVVRPNVKIGWNIATERSDYPEPVVVYGETFESGVSKITWTGGSIPSNFMDSFLLSAYITDRPGETLTFIARQRCEGSEEPEEFPQEISVRAKRPSSPPPPSTEKAPAGDSSGEAPSSESTPASETATSRDLGTVLGGLGFIFGLVALLVSLRRR